jgi:mono/diheme cytochrome c family protein
MPRVAAVLLVAFAAAITAPFTAAPAQSSLPTTPVVDGTEVFRQTCVACHGEDGRGGQGGGAPLDGGTKALILTIVRDGRGNMPPLGDVLTAEQIEAVADYVVTELFGQKAP